MLGKDEMGDLPECNFNYASVVGMLLHLTGHSHPELTFAVSQCARFTHAPKRSHELALIRIGQHLKGCRDDCLIMKPTKLNEIQMDVYVDSDFLGLHGKEKRSDPDNVRSRAGYVIMLNGAPIVWCSRLIKDVCLSTMMAEYYALSMALREVLPLRDLVQAMSSWSRHDW